MEGKIDVVIIGGSTACDRNLMLIVNIKKINMDTKVLVIAEEDGKNKVIRLWSRRI
jgi:heptaprenylglyceryl phosphate synthase